VLYDIGWALPDMYTIPISECTIDTHIAHMSGMSASIAQYGQHFGHCRYTDTTIGTLGASILSASLYRAAERLIIHYTLQGSAISSTACWLLRSHWRSKPYLDKLRHPAYFMVGTYATYVQCNSFQCLDHDFSGRGLLSTRLGSVQGTAQTT
jgi:hypothetical protein